MLSRRTIALCALLAVLAFGWLTWTRRSSLRQPEESSAPTIHKQPVNFAIRTFDPAAPPADMPPMAPGEEAVCDSNFLSNAVVAGESRQTDATHATVTITRITVTLQLNIAIWAPADATQHVLDHEEGHRRISEFYYQTADQVAQRVAARYLGRQVFISGTDLDADFSKWLQQMGAEITDEYNQELNPDPAQQRYDAVTNHSRNDVDAKDAVAQILRELDLASTPPANPGN